MKKDLYQVKKSFEELENFIDTIISEDDKNHLMELIKKYADNLSAHNLHQVLIQ